MATSAEDRNRSRNDLAWAISVGGVATVGFAILLVATWYFASTLFLIFAGVLLGIALCAMTNLLGRVTELPHSLRLAAICLVLLALLCGVLFLGGATIAQQATVLGNTIKSQVVNLKTFLEKYGVDTSYLDIGNLTAAPAGQAATTDAPAAPHNLPTAAQTLPSSPVLLPHRQDSSGFHRSHSGCDTA